MPRPRLIGLAALAALLAAQRVAGSPLELLQPGDPLNDELRVLELYDPAPDSARLALPHLASRPLQRFELMGAGAPPDLSGARGLAAWRIERALERDATLAFASAATPRSTPRAFQRAWPGDQRLELSAGIEGGWDGARSGGARTGRWLDGTGLHLRAGAQVNGWLAYTHLAFAELRGASAYTDVLVQRTDLAAQTEESAISYTAGRAWTVGIGRGRWSWGPGEEGSLLLSGSSAPITALWLRGRLAALRADGAVIQATLDPGRGEQLAAHRIEWQPSDGVRLGLAEAARYRSSGWQGVYLASVIPFAIAQRLLQQDSHGAPDSVRNNVALAADAAWRVADGLRVYGELLADDLHARTASVPNKYGWQAGLDGAGVAFGTRLTWNVEDTWLSRYVYTSFFGRAFTAQGRPLGFPTGPDSRRLRARVAWDPRRDWQVLATAARTRSGADGLDTPFVPGSPVPDVAKLAGPVERADAFEGTLRWWPASGVDVAASLGWRRVDDAGHVAGVSERETTASFAFRLVR